MLNTPGHASVNPAGGVGCVDRRKSPLHLHDSGQAAPHDSAPGREWGPAGAALGWQIFWGVAGTRAAGLPNLLWGELVPCESDFLHMLLQRYSQSLCDTVSLCVVQSVFCVVQSASLDSMLLHAIQVFQCNQVVRNTMTTSTD